MLLGLGYLPIADVAVNLEDGFCFEAHALERCVNIRRVHKDLALLFGCDIAPPRRPCPAWSRERAEGRAGSMKLSKGMRLREAMRLREGKALQGGRQTVGRDVAGA